MPRTGKPMNSSIDALLLIQVHRPAIGVIIKFITGRRLRNFLDIVWRQVLQAVRIMTFGGVILLHSLVQ